MFSYYFTIGLIYLVVGFGVALFFFFVLKKPVIGRFWGALLVAVIGSFLGGVIDYFFSGVIEKLSNLAQAVNIFPSIIIAFFVLWLFSRFGREE